MPEDIPAGTAAPAAPVTAAAPPAAVPAPAQPPATAAAPAAAPAVPATPAAPAPGATVEPKEGDPNWLKQRFAQNANATTAKLLKDLGVTTIDEAKAKIDTAKKLEDEKKTDIQRANEKVKALEPDAARTKELIAIITERAETELGTLTEAQREAVKEFAGEDPAKQLQTIDRFRKRGLLAASAPAAPEVTAAPTVRPAITPPASTSSAGGAPPPASPTTPNHKATYEKLLTQNPMQAAAYALKNERAIFGDGQSSSQ